MIMLEGIWPRTYLSIRCQRRVDMGDLCMKNDSPKTEDGHSGTELAAAKV